MDNAQAHTHWLTHSLTRARHLSISVISCAWWLWMYTYRLIQPAIHLQFFNELRQAWSEIDVSIHSCWYLLPHLYTWARDPCCFVVFVASMLGSASPFFLCSLLSAQLCIAMLSDAGFFDVRMFSCKTVTSEWTLKYGAAQDTTTIGRQHWWIAV